MFKLYMVLFCTFFKNYTFLKYGMVSHYIYVCVCVCVRERERERETDLKFNWFKTLWFLHLIIYLPEK